jgi:hypothetical protein
MDEQARLGGGGWRLVVTRIRALTPALPGGVASAARLFRHLWPLAQFWTWRYALLPVAVAVSLLIVSGRSISWWLVAVEALALVFALSGWGVLRAHRPDPRGAAILGSGGGLLFIAAVGGLILARVDGPIILLGLVALALMALDIAPTFVRVSIPEFVTLAARLILAPALVGLGLVVVTAQTQGARVTYGLWLLGFTMSLLAFAAELARMAAASQLAERGVAFWRRPAPYLALALALAGILTVWVALPRGAPHGLLLALAALPLALVAVTGLGRSTFVPARRWAARRIGTVYTYVGLALTVGALTSAAASVAVAALTKALGF